MMEGYDGYPSPDEVEEESTEDIAEETETVRSPWVIIHTDGTHLRVDGTLSNKWTAECFELGSYHRKEGLADSIVEEIVAGEIDPCTDPTYFRWEGSITIERDTIKTLFYPQDITPDRLEEWKENYKSVLCDMYPVPGLVEETPRRGMSLNELNERMKHFKKHHGMKKPNEVQLSEVSDFFYTVGIEPSFKLHPIEEEEEEDVNPE